MFDQTELETYSTITRSTTGNFQGSYAIKKLFKEAPKNNFLTVKKNHMLPFPMLPFVDYHNKYTMLPIVNLQMKILKNGRKIVLFLQESKNYKKYLIFNNVFSFHILKPFLTLVQMPSILF